ncbi:hypothetical protein [Atopomonas sediminilitoris]|uniref:hypothetical protein n=1 Tax=Atopomonas sediminilitoris TaxID=2919919 RepID=UPI001F4EDBD6|nr:hypothetical protein [Atopomonas sediminilitoris]MCJ8168624.1 hypothetical protein [Atopomonas sediminilitoris]
MTLPDIRAQALSPALALLPSRMESPQAEVMLLAIGLQESRFIHRRQIGGPAKSFWQFELNGVRAVLKHSVVGDIAKQCVGVCRVEPDPLSVHNAIEYDDVLAACMARLLLYADPLRLPALGDVWGAWDLYLRTWRPGKPHRGTWDALYAQALEAVCPPKAA